MNTPLIWHIKAPEQKIFATFLLSKHSNTHVTLLSSENANSQLP